MPAPRSPRRTNPGRVPCSVRLLVIGLVLVLVAASCGDDGDSGSGDVVENEATEDGTSDGSDAPNGTTSSAPSTEITPTSETPVEAAPEWIAHEAPEDCQCADGSDYWVHSLTQNPEKVVLYFQGGGACFTEAMCDFEDGTYKVTTSADDHPGTGDAFGIFDFETESNPFADWSVVFVPYCTGDVFLGDATATYGDLTVEHNGFANAGFGLDILIETFPDATDIFVTGSSAGGVPAPLFGGLASDAFPDATISVLADASGGYASNPATNLAIGGLWGTANNIPDWPELDGLDPALFGIPDLFTFSGQHDPDIRMARYDNAFDEVQVSFAAMAGDDSSLLDVLDTNESSVEAGGVDLDVYVAPGTEHTVLLRPDVYTLEVEGVAFIDWLTEFVESGDPGDVRCTDCGEPTGAS